MPSWVIFPLLRITVYSSHVSFWEGQALTESRMTWFSKSLLKFLFYWNSRFYTKKPVVLGLLEFLVVLGRIEAMLCVDLGHDKFEVI